MISNTGTPQPSVKSSTLTIMPSIKLHLDPTGKTIIPEQRRVTRNMFRSKIQKRVEESSSSCLDVKVKKQVLLEGMRMGIATQENGTPLTPCP
jgi:hypothetical protein